LVTGHVPDGRAELRAGHCFEDPRGDRKAFLPPTLRLGANQHVVREKPEMRRRPDFASQIAGEMQVFGDDVEGPPRR
jgi:hypothetical protein